MTALRLDQYYGQDILDLFSKGFESTLTDPELESRIQAVKGALFDRDYVQAFGSAENLDAYVVRWSPSRALGYSALFQSLGPIRALFSGQNEVNVVAVGAGAGAEVVALGSMAFLDPDYPARARVLAIDIAEWGPVIDKIVARVADDWYNWNQPGSVAGADTEATESLEQKLSKLSLDSSPFQVKFVNHDILTYPVDQLNLSKVQLVTSMFTTNELFASSRGQTVQFLKSLRACPPGALLLLVESAGSYSQVKVGTKVFPVQFLIDHSLTSDGTWKLVESSDSKWFRLSDNLNYGLKLENMRFFYRLYERQ